MLKMTMAGLLATAFATVANGQQNQNLFPGDSLPGTIRQSANEGVNTLYNDAQLATQNTLQQVNQAAQQTVDTAATTVDDTAKSWSRFLQPNPTENTLIDRWNEGTKNFFAKTKQALTPPPIDKPLINLPRLDPNRSLFPKLPTLGSPNTKKNAEKRSLFPAMFKRQQPPPPKPTVQDFIGLPRPE